MAFTHRHAASPSLDARPPRPWGRTVGSQITMVHLIYLGVILVLKNKNHAYISPNSTLTGCTHSPSKLPKYVGINCVSPDMDVWLTFGGLGRPFESVSNLSISMRIHNFVGAARRELQEGGFAVEPSLLVGCGLKTHDVNPNKVWTS
jgi:hypothetical protein